MIPVRVQGQGSAREIARAIDFADRQGRFDVLIVGRGGGSLEDLWSFNEEVVARAIAGAQTPVVSAVGHESDVTISDHVADVRAATPSQAGELVVPVLADVLAQLDRTAQRLARTLRTRIDHAWQRLEALGERPVLRDPAALIAPFATGTRALADRLRAASPQVALHRQRERLEAARARLGPPMRHRFVRAADRLAHAQGRWARSTIAPQAARRQRVRALADRLRALSPLAVLGRGYAIVWAGDRVVRREADVAPGDRLRTRVADGAHVTSRVEGVDPPGMGD